MAFKYPVHRPSSLKGYCSETSASIGFGPCLGNCMGSCQGFTACLLNSFTKLNSLAVRHLQLNVGFKMSVPKVFIKIASSFLPWGFVGSFPLRLVAAGFPSWGTCHVSPYPSLMDITGVSSSIATVQSSLLGCLHR